jgi:hypothetical protein
MIDDWRPRTLRNINKKINKKRHVITCRTRIVRRAAQAGFDAFSCIDLYSRYSSRP